MVHDTSVRPVSDKQVKSTLANIGDENGCARSVRTFEEDTRSVERPTVSHSRTSRRHKNRSGYITHSKLRARGGLILGLYKASCPDPWVTSKEGRVRNIQGGKLEER